MPQLARDHEDRLLAAMEYLESAGDLAAETGIPLRQVIHYQRLYGPSKIQVQRADEDRIRVAKMRQESAEVAREDMLRRSTRPHHRTIAMIAATREERWRR